MPEGRSQGILSEAIRHCGEIEIVRDWSSREILEGRDETLEVGTEEDKKEGTRSGWKETIGRRR